HRGPNKFADRDEGGPPAPFSSASPLNECTPEPAVPGQKPSKRLQKVSFRYIRGCDVTAPSRHTVVQVSRVGVRVLGGNGDGTFHSTNGQGASAWAEEPTAVQAAGKRSFLGGERLAVASSRVE